MLAGIIRYCYALVIKNLRYENFLLDKKRLSYKGFGGSKPIYMIPELSEEERQANRRVEIQIVSL